MSLAIHDEYHTLSSHVADEIISQVKQKSESVLCLAAGDTPRLAYNLLVEKANRDHLDFSRCAFIGLDEWVGIPPNNPGSCAFFLQHNLFTPLGIAPAQVHLFNSMTGDLEAECDKMNTIISEKGPMDLMLVGVGMNGHIGFNEPGVKEDLYAHVVDLDATTQSVGQKYFLETTTLTKGITLGLRHLMESRHVILMASGSNKAHIIRKVLEGAISTQVPASFIRKHPRALSMLDKEAAALLAIT